MKTHQGAYGVLIDNLERLRRDFARPRHNIPDVNRIYWHILDRPHNVHTKDALKAILRRRSR